MTKTIIVAGAGHGGLVAAMYLAKEGYDVTVYEQKARNNLGYEQTDSIHLDGFEKAGIEIPSEFIVKRTPIAFCIPGTDIEPVVQGDSNDSFTVEADRKKLYNYLIDLCEKAGVKFNFECKINAPVILGSRVVGIKLQRKTVYADMIIDACGINSVLRQNLPEFMHIQNKPIKHEYFCTYRAYFNRKETENEPEYKYRLYLIPGEFCAIMWVITNKDNTDFFIGSFTQLNDDIVNKYLEFARKDNPQVGNKLIKGNNYALIPVRQPLAVLVADGYAAVGDSAFMTVPIKGSGVGYAMRAGKMLAETIISDKDGLYNRETLWNYQVKFFDEIGSKSCILAAIKSILPYLTLDDLSYVFKDNLLSSEDLKKFGNEEGLLKIVASLKPSIIKDKAKKIAGHPNVRKLLFDIAKHIAQVKFIETYMHQKYNSSSIEKWNEVYNNFFSIINDRPNDKI